MKHTTRRLVLMTAAATALAATGFAQANSLFGAGNNGVYSEQQRFEKDKGDKDKGENSNSGGSHAGSSNHWPRPVSTDTPTNQVPEPETLGLVAVGLVAAWAASRRRRKN